MNLGNGHMGINYLYCSFNFFIHLEIFKVRWGKILPWFLFGTFFLLNKKQLVFCFVFLMYKEYNKVLASAVMTDGNSGMF